MRTLFRFYHLQTKTNNGDRALIFSEVHRICYTTINNSQFRLTLGEGRVIARGFICKVNLYKLRGTYFSLSKSTMTFYLYIP